MKLIEILKVAIAAIWAHKMRSALTLLGMIVGVTAFVTVVSLIQGFNVYIDEKIAGIGAKSFSVQRFNPFEDFKDTDTIAAAQRRNKELTLDDYDYLKEKATLIGKIGAKARGSPSEVKRGDQVLQDTFVSGATANTADIDNRNIEFGRFFVDVEAESATRGGGAQSGVVQPLHLRRPGAGSDATESAGENEGELRPHDALRERRMSDPWAYTCIGGL